MLKIFCLVFFIAFSGSLMAQNRIGCNSLGGYVIAHRPVMQRLITGHATGIELTWEKTCIGEKNWHKEYKNPLIGVSFTSADLGNSSQLGTALGLTPYFRLPLNPRRNLDLTLGLGLGYLTKYYSQTENSKNVAIGSPINASICIGMWYRINLMKTVALQTGIRIHHFSNGAFRSPNLGINIPTISLGLIFGQNNLTGNKNQEITTLTEKKTTWYLSPRFGAKELMQTGKKLYPTYAIHLARMRTISAKLTYSLFSDLLYNSSIEEELESKSVQLKHKSEGMQCGFGAGFDNTYGNFAIYLQMAGYLYSKQTEVGRFYHRLGIKQQLPNNQYISFGLKSHFAKADYLELGWGIRL